MSIIQDRHAAIEYLTRDTHQRICKLTRQELDDLLHQCNDLAVTASGTLLIAVRIVRDIAVAENELRVESL